MDDRRRSWAPGQRERAAQLIEEGVPPETVSLELGVDLDLVMVVALEPSDSTSGACGKRLPVEDDHHVRCDEPSGHAPPCRWLGGRTYRETTLRGWLARYEVGRSLCSRHQDACPDDCDIGGIPRVLARVGPPPIDEEWDALATISSLNRGSSVEEDSPDPTPSACSSGAATTDSSPERPVGNVAESQLDTGGSPASRTSVQGRIQSPVDEVLDAIDNGTVCMLPGCGRPKSKGVDYCEPCRDAEAAEVAAMRSRMESGPIQFGDDWPGLFLRGDEAVPFGMTLHGHIAAVPLTHLDGITRAVLIGLADTLVSCEQGRRAPRVLPSPNQPRPRASTRREWFRALLVHLDEHRGQGRDVDQIEAEAIGAIGPPPFEPPNRLAGPLVGDDLAREAIRVDEAHRAAIGAAEGYRILRIREIVPMPPANPVTVTAVRHAMRLPYDEEDEKKRYNMPDPDALAPAYSRLYDVAWYRDRAQVGPAEYPVSLDDLRQLLSLADGYLTLTTYELGQKACVVKLCDVWRARRARS